MVAIGTIAYVGNHGGELLRPGATRAEVDPQLRSGPRACASSPPACTPRAPAPARAREDKDSIAAFHWRGAPDEERAPRPPCGRSPSALEQEGLAVHWGRKVLEVRPPVVLNKGLGVAALLGRGPASAALYVGDDTTDLDAFRGLRELVSSGALESALCVAVASDEVPAELAREADLTVDGTAGVRALLEALL